MADAEQTMQPDSPRNDAADFKAIWSMLRCYSPSEGYTVMQSPKECAR